MEIRTVSDLRKAFRSGPYVWPGGYPVFFLMSDGAAISFKAAKEERRQIIESLAHHIHDGWHPAALAINWEDDDLYCEHTGEKIECAYCAEEGE